MFLHTNLSPKWSLQLPSSFDQYTRRWEVGPVTLRGCREKQSYCQCGFANLCCIGGEKQTQHDGACCF